MSLVIYIISLLAQPSPLYIVSPDFPNDGYIPARCTCDGENINPTLIVNGIPEGTRSLAVVGEDADSTSGSLTQWLVWNIPPSETLMDYHIRQFKEVDMVGWNSYRGPCPDDERSNQRYAFKVFALDTLLSLSPDACRDDVERAMAGHILAKGQLMGQYSRSAQGEKKQKKNNPGR